MEKVQKLVYVFHSGQADGDKDMKVLLGGKGANLAEMAAIGLPVPPGFTVTTEVCTDYVRNNNTFPTGLKVQVESALRDIEDVVGCRFADPNHPLLLSVRSGARVSMPGMMDTVLNLGLNDATVLGLAKASGDTRFAYDCYRRFISMYSDIVFNIDMHEFECELEKAKDKHGVELDHQLTAEQLMELVDKYKAVVHSHKGISFPFNPLEQLWGAIGAVFGSWQNKRAVAYRRLNRIPNDWGTAVNVQAMVFGNKGEDCATGVAFTRNPSTGENAFYGEYLVNAQGEDVVAGIRTPQSITVAGKHGDNSALPAMEEAMPKIYSELVGVRDKLESHYRDVQDIEFTVENNKLYILQTRSGKRTAQAAVRIAVEMAEEGLITHEEAIMRVSPNSLTQLLHPWLDPKANVTVIARGLPASPGAASGTVVFTADEAVTLADEGKPVVLVRIETSADDIHGMHSARAILTARGGMTSHAAVVARGMGRACVAGASDLNISYAMKSMKVGDFTVHAGDMITIDGGTGAVMLGAVPTVQPKLSDHFAKLMHWADDTRHMRVLANAETPVDSRTARRFGAEGIGLVRTEHMFFEAERITAMHQMILAEDSAGRRAALAKLLPMQRNDLTRIFEVMSGLPVTVRLLDPPLHEFLPRTDQEIGEVSRATGIEAALVRESVQRHHEMNPMLGHRGCRLLISYPEICEMQARAIFEASLAAKVVPDVMVPLVATRAELEILAAVIEEVANKVRVETGELVEYTIGCMIELPRAALCADKIASKARFFSFGTNDLTQTTYGLSRDDASRILKDYKAKGVLTCDPFVMLDEQGVGELISTACERGRRTRPDISLGICGEHGGDPASIDLCERLGLHYVSCSPYRVPVARLAAAQATIRCSKS